VGFVLGPAALRETLAARLGPWTLTGPAQLIARHALADRVWQAAMRAQLAGEAERLARLLATHGAPGCTGTALFRYLACPDAARWQAHLARRAIWVRRFDAPAALRLGLPGEPAGWQRLDAALAEGRRAGLRLTPGPTP
jgi:cobalamin biosynthetic protein CobC